jgi:uncharacterized protein (DUF362 family)
MNKEKPVIYLKRVTPETILDDYRDLMHQAEYQKRYDKNEDLILKLNLSWSKFFPACSSPPWQVEGVIRTLKEDGFQGNKIFASENETVVTNIEKGLKGNKWGPIITKYGVYFVPLTKIEFIKFKPDKPLRVMDSKIFPNGFSIPKFYIGRNIIHLPTFKTHGHTGAEGGEFKGKKQPEGGITCAMKNAFGGLLTKRRHFSHQYMSEVLVDLLQIQQQIHPHIMAVVDGTVAGDGAGPRCMIPKIKNVIMAGYDQVAVDAAAAKIMGFDPLSLPFIRMAHEDGLGCGDIDQIEFVGDTDIAKEDWGFKVKRSLVVWGDQQVRKGKLRMLEPLLHTKLMIIPTLLSMIYHDMFWYNTVGKSRIKNYMNTEWGTLFKSYPDKIPPGQRINKI